MINNERVEVLMLKIYLDNLKVGDFYVEYENFYIFWFLEYIFFRFIFLRIVFKVVFFEVCLDIFWIFWLNLKICSLESLFKVNGMLRFIRLVLIVCLIVV